MPDVALLEWAKDAVRDLGTQKEAAEAIGIPYATLQRVLAGNSPLTIDRIEKIAAAVGANAADVLATNGAAGGRAPLRENSSMSFVPLHDVVVSAGHGASAVEAGDSAESLGFPTGWLWSQFGDPRKLRIVHVKGDSMAQTLGDGDLVMINIDRRDPVDGIFVLRLDDQLMVKRVHFPSARRVLVTSDNRDYDRFDRLIDLEREDGFRLIGRVVWAGKSI